jgi:hypothetical protein
MCEVDVAKVAIRQRVDFGFGYAETDAMQRPVRVGDRLAPAAIDVHCPGADGQPALYLRLEVVDGVPQCRQLRITSSADGRAVKPLDLDAVRLSDWVDEIYALHVVEKDEHGTIIMRAPTDDALDASEAAFRTARRGKGARKIDRRFLERVAEVYRDHLDGAPTKAVEEAFGVSHRQASNYVRSARDLGALGETTRGKKGA